MSSKLEGPVEFIRSLGLLSGKFAFDSGCEIEEAILLGLFIFLVEADCENVFVLFLIVEYLLGAIANQEGAGSE